jgi:hypothetical protein
VFDQERFDWLARGLATGRLTRWQVIKGFGAGVLLGSAGLLQPWSARSAEAQTRAVNKAPPVNKAPLGSPSNPRLSPLRAATCDKFNRKIQTTGVTDERGNTYEGATAVTTYNCAYHRSYRADSISKPGKVCLSVTKLNVTFDKWSTARGKVTVADWRPPTPQTRGCKLEEKWFRENAVDHERWHIGDINKVVSAATDRWRKNPPKFGVTCASTTEEQAKLTLEEKIDSRATAECDRIEKDIKRRA